MSVQDIIALGVVLLAGVYLVWRVVLSMHARTGCGCGLRSGQNDKDVSTAAGHDGMIRRPFVPISEIGTPRERR